jgi:HSP20 family protein
MANNHQQVPFWEFIRAFNQSNLNGAGVDHPMEDVNQRFRADEAGPGPQDFPFGPDGWGFGGRGGRPWGRSERPGRRGKHGRRHNRDDNDDDNDNDNDHDHDNEKTPSGSRSPSANRENPDGEPREPQDGDEPGRSKGCGGRRGTGGRGHHGPREFGRGCHGPRGAWAGVGRAFADWDRPRGPFRGPMISADTDLNLLFDRLSSHPVAQAFRNAAEASRSGEPFAPPYAYGENTFVPPVDVFSTENSYILHVALPGAKKEDVGVNWDSDKSLLNVAGVVHRQGDEEFLKSLTKSERKVGVFDRSIKLPPGSEEKEEVDGEAITAKLDDGVLVVVVPKVEKEWTEVKKVNIL